MMHVLVCGDAGYIGAHMAKALARAGCEVTVFNNLSTGHRAAVQWSKLVEGDLLDKEALERLFQAHRFDAVMHFCALSQVAESVRDPYTYYRNNVYATRDGTCVRDYVHVNDLARAHLLAMHHLDNHEGAHRFNLGSGSGFTVMEVIEAARKVTDKSISFSLAPRRVGDRPVLVADSERAGTRLAPIVRRHASGHRKRVALALQAALLRNISDEKAAQTHPSRKLRARHQQVVARGAVRRDGSWHRPHDANISRQRLLRCLPRPGRRQPPDAAGEPGLCRRSHDYRR
jgi:hypothetical protein